MQPLTLPYHHGEPVDPDLIAWLLDKMHDVLTVGPWAGVLAFGAVIIIPPLIIIAVVWLRRRAAPGTGAPTAVERDGIRPES